jgi:hypothetical protein
MKSIVIIILLIVFLAGLYVYSVQSVSLKDVYVNNRGNRLETFETKTNAATVGKYIQNLIPDVNISKENFESIQTQTKPKKLSDRCPRVLVKSGNHILLYNSSNFQEEEPTVFYNLDEYINYVNYQKSLGNDCPVLFLQQENDAQGNDVYRLRPSPFEQHGGMNPLSVPYGTTVRSYEGMTPMNSPAPISTPISAPISTPISAPVSAPAPAPVSAYSPIDTTVTMGSFLNDLQGLGTTTINQTSCGKMTRTAQCGGCGRKQCGNTCGCGATNNAPAPAAINPLITPPVVYANQLNQTSQNYQTVSPPNDQGMQPFPQLPPVTKSSFTTDLPVDPAAIDSLGRTGLQTIPKNLPRVPMATGYIAEDAPYNVGDYPPFDAHNQHVGAYTNLDQIHDATALPPYSDNAMDPNWGGTNYTIQAINSDKYTDNQIFKPMYTASNKNITVNLDNPLYNNIIRTPAGAAFLATLNKNAYNPNVIK